MSESQLQTVADAMLTEASAQLDICAAYLNAATGTVRLHGPRASRAHVARLRRQRDAYANLAMELARAVAIADGDQAIAREDAR